MAKKKKVLRYCDARENQIRGVIEYLNEMAGKKYRVDCEPHRKIINARFNSGYTMEDMMSVIDIKSAQWKDDHNMNRYLRPSTLFRPSNFEAYLNELPPGKNNKKTHNTAHYIAMGQRSENE